jgi:L-alanine-DL-glutamate epimerase-like enolase superfamily enzyme
MWPLEVALWDLIGKLTGQPLWRLLGGRSNQVTLYASTGQRLPLEERVAAVQRLQAAGAIYSPHTWGDGLVLLS